MPKILHTQISTANPRWVNSPFMVDDVGNITAFNVHVDFDQVDDQGVIIGGGTRVEDIWPLLTNAQRTAFQAFYSRVAAKIAEYA